MKKKKILMVMPCDLPVPAVYGGAVQTLVESLIRSNETFQKIEISVITNGDAETRNKAKEYPNTQFFWFVMPEWLAKADHFISSKRVLRKLMVIRYAQQVLRKQNFDYVILQNSGYLLKIFKDKVLQKRYENRIYYHLHNDVPTNVDKSILKQCKFLLISHYLERKLSQIAGPRVLDKCYLLQNCIDIKKFTQELQCKEKTSIKEALRIRSNQKVAIYVGRISPEKGILEVLNAFKMFNDDKYVLLIIGSASFGLKSLTPFEKEVQTLCERYKDRIRFTGYIHNSSIWKYYKTADVAVLPSMWEEPAGLTMLEASASGVPLITTISGGIQEYINKDYCVTISRDEGISLKIHDNIIDICNNIERWRECVEKEKEWVIERYNDDVYYESFIKKLI